MTIPPQRLLQNFPDTTGRGLYQSLRFISDNNDQYETYTFDWVDDELGKSALQTGCQNSEVERRLRPPRARTTPGSQHARLVAKLTQAVHARDAFIAIAAHELRNPMTPMLGYVEHILSVSRRPENECPEEIIVALERLSNQIAEYIKRATTLLDISRITAGKLRAELSVVDLSAMILQAVHRHRAGAERSGCRLEPSIECEVSGLLDALAVAQIADNLLSNALKYGAGEPIEISLVRNAGLKQRFGESRVDLMAYGRTPWS